LLICNGLLDDIEAGEPSSGDLPPNDPAGVWIKLDVTNRGVPKNEVCKESARDAAE
jgi:hypothetical protein